jgi:nucleotide-binding universal stress UspA family protein
MRPRWRWPRPIAGTLAHELQPLFAELAGTGAIELPLLPVRGSAAEPILDVALVASDFSELGNRAVPYAYELARAAGTVTFCHVREAGGVRTTLTLVDRGQAATGIVQEANRQGVDAICVGSHGRSGLGRALMGSVAETVARHAQRPVLIVRPGT